MAYQKLLRDNNIKGGKPTNVIGVCVWCAGDATTEDHLVPRWVRRRLLQLGKTIQLAVVPSCFTCNGRKGPLPPAVYARMREPDGYARRSKGDWKAETYEWLTIAGFFRSWKAADLPEELVEYVAAVMAEEVPHLRGLPSPKQDHSRKTRTRKDRRKASKLRKDAEPLPTLAEVWPER